MMLPYAELVCRIDHWMRDNIDKNKHMRPHDLMKDCEKALDPQHEWTFKQRGEALDIAMHFWPTLERRK